MKLKIYATVSATPGRSKEKIYLVYLKFENENQGQMDFI
jgi:hypothetical protein